MSVHMKRSDIVPLSWNGSKRSLLLKTCKECNCVFCDNNLKGWQAKWDRPFHYKANLCHCTGIMYGNAHNIILLCSWPLILDPDSKCLRWINNLHRNRIIRQVQQGEDEEEISSTLKKCIRGGDIAIFYDVVAYDSCLDSVLTQKVITKGKVRNSVQWYMYVTYTAIGITI